MYLDTDISENIWSILNWSREPFSRNHDLKKKFKKIVTSNISEIYGSIILCKEFDREIQFESSKRTMKNINKMRHIEKWRVSRWKYPTGIPAVPPFFGQPPSGLLTRYPSGIPGRSGIPVGSIQNILVNI